MEYSFAWREICLPLGGAVNSPLLSHTEVVAGCPIQKITDEGKQRAVLSTVLVDPAINVQVGHVDSQLSNENLGRMDTIFGAM
jgi:hypothetical protein